MRNKNKTVRLNFFNSSKINIFKQNNPKINFVMNKLTYFTFLIAIFLISCSGNKSEETSDVIIEEKQETACIWNGVPVRKTPDVKTKNWISSISLGETVTYLGETAIDSADKNREYLKIELSDGKTGWAPSYGLIIGGKPAAIKEEVPIYKRPDLLTLSEKSFQTMDIIVIKEVKDEWAEVVGEKKKLGGWIKRDAITEVKEDIAFAILAKKELEKKEGFTVESLTDFIDNSPYSNSVFMNHLKEMIVEMEQEMETQENIEEITEEVNTEDGEDI